MEALAAVASGDEKPLAILGVLRAGIADALIVDEVIAKVVLDLARTKEEARADRADARDPG
jgi:DNA-binding transcriptional regulator LsrR (DeoR family)